MYLCFGCHVNKVTWMPINLDSFINTISPRYKFNTVQHLTLTVNMVDLKPCHLVIFLIFFYIWQFASKPLKIYWSLVTAQWIPTNKMCSFSEWTNTTQSLGVETANQHISWKWHHTYLCGFDLFMEKMPAVCITSRQSSKQWSRVWNCFVLWILANMFEINPHKLKIRKE